MKRKSMLWLPLVAVLLFSAFANLGIMQTTPKIYVDPPSIVDPSKGVGSVFTVSVNIADVENLYGWSFRLLFDKDIVQVTGISIPSPSFLRSAGPTIVLVRKYDNVAGYATAAEMLWPYPETGASGSGTLAIVSFSVVGVGVTALDLVQTKLNTVIAGNTVPMDHLVEDGAFDNRAVNLPPVALFSVAPLIGTEGTVFTFDASASHDDGWIASYFWDFGDGTTATSEIVEHVWTAGAAGTYAVSLTVTDNNGVSSSAQYNVEVVSWMLAGDHPDLIRTLIWPELPVFKEAEDGEHETLWAKVGNPTDKSYKIRVDFDIFSKDEARKLGTISTAEETILPHEIKDLQADFFLGDHRWATTTGPYDWPYWVKKYWAIGRCFYQDDTSEWKAGIFPGANQFKIHPVTHDRAIIDVSMNYSLASPAHIGDTVEINVTIENQGQQIEHDIQVKLSVVVPSFYAVGTATTTLGIGDNQTFTFNWQVPVGIELGNIVFKAEVDKHPYERDISDQIVYAVIAVV